MTKDEIAEVLRTLTPEEMHTALNFLTGNDPAAVEDAIRYTRLTSRRHPRRSGTVYGIRPHLQLSPEEDATQKRYAEEFLRQSCYCRAFGCNVGCPCICHTRELGPE